MNRRKKILWIALLILLLITIDKIEKKASEGNFDLNIIHDLEDAEIGGDVFIEIDITNNYQDLYYKDNPSPPGFVLQTITDSSYFAYIIIYSDNNVVFADERLLIGPTEPPFNKGEIKKVRFDWHITNSQEFGEPKLSNLKIKFGIYFQPIIVSPHDIVIQKIANNLQMSTEEETIGSFLNYVTHFEHEQDGMKRPPIGIYQNIEDNILKYIPSGIQVIWSHKGYCSTKSALLTSLYLQSGFNAKMVDNGQGHSYVILERDMPYLDAYGYPASYYETCAIQGWWETDPTCDLKSINPIEVYNEFATKYPPGWQVCLLYPSVLDNNILDQTEFIFETILYGECIDTIWAPNPSTINKGTTFTQTSNCGNTRSAVGTKEPIIPSDDKEWYESPFVWIIGGFMVFMMIGGRRR